MQSSQHPQHAASPHAVSSQHASPIGNDEPVITPVHLAPDPAAADRVEIVDDENGRVLACGFPSPDAARRWVQNHNRLSGWHQLLLADA